MKGSGAAEGYLGEVWDRGCAEELVWGKRGGDGEDGHAGGAGGGDTGRGVFDDEAVCGCEAEEASAEEEAFRVGFAVGNVLRANEDVGEWESGEAEAGFGEVMGRRSDDGPLVGLEGLDELERAGDGGDAVAAGGGFGVHGEGLGERIEVGRELLDGFAGGPAVGDGEDVAEGDSVAVAPRLPHGLDAGGGVDEGSVHVEEDCLG